MRVVCTSGADEDTSLLRLRARSRYLHSPASGRNDCGPSPARPPRDSNPPAYRSGRGSVIGRKWPISRTTRVEQALSRTHRERERARHPMQLPFHSRPRRIRVCRPGESRPEQQSEKVLLRRRIWRHPSELGARASGPQQSDPALTVAMKSRLGEHYVVRVLVGREIGPERARRFDERSSHWAAFSAIGYRSDNSPDEPADRRPYDLNYLSGSPVTASRSA